MNKKRPLEEPRQPGEVSISFRIKDLIRNDHWNAARGGFCVNFNEELNKNEPMQPEEGFVSF